jgi:DNA-binding transcriptional LysR family regulator
MRRFSLAQIEALLAIARLGSFHAAAAHINVTQPTISLRIRELETAMGRRLFEREGRGVVLTAEGAVAVRYAEQAVGLFDQLEARLRTGDPLQGTLRVGSSETIAMTCLAEIVHRLESRYPQLQVEMTVSNSFVLCDKLSARELDIAFLVGPGVSRYTTVEPLAVVEMAWLGSAAKPLASRMLWPADLARLNLLSVPPPSPLHELVTNWCMAGNSPMPVFNTCTSVAIIAKLILAGVGISALPVCVVSDELEQGLIVRYEQRDPFAPLRVCAAYPRGPEAEGLHAVVSMARSVMRENPYFALLEEG